jgi:hypothetical protein
VRDEFCFWLVDELKMYADKLRENKDDERFEWTYLMLYDEMLEVMSKYRELKITAEV